MQISLSLKCLQYLVMRNLMGVKTPGKSLGVGVGGLTAEPSSSSALQLGFTKTPLYKKDKAALTRGFVNINFEFRISNFAKRDYRTIIRLFIVSSPSITWIMYIPDESFSSITIDVFNEPATVNWLL